MWRRPRNTGFLHWRCGLPDAHPLRPAVFLDRDGTVSEEVGYLNHISRFHLLPGAAEAIRRLNEAEFPVIVVTNQSGVARGYFPESLVLAVHELMTQRLAEQRARLDGIYYCPHGSSEECDCRKPKIGMLTRAAKKQGLDLRRSFVVGDRYGDIQLAHHAGCRSVFVRTGYGEGDLLWNGPKWRVQPDFVAANLVDAVNWILRPGK